MELVFNLRALLFLAQNRPGGLAGEDAVVYGERVAEPGVGPGAFPGPAAGVQQLQAERHRPARLRQLLRSPQHGTGTPRSAGCASPCAFG